MAEGKNNLLEKVKSMLGVTGPYQDGTLQAYIEEVQQYLVDGGAKKEIIDAPDSAGVIARGVCDLWNYGAGDGKLSPYFKERAVQLSYKPLKQDIHKLYHISDEEIHDMIRGGDENVR